MIDTLTLAAVTTGAVSLIRDETGASLNWTRGRLILLTLAVAEIVSAGAIALGYLDLWTSWQVAARTGFDVFLSASGLYTVNKALVGNQVIRSLVGAPVEEAKRRIARATGKKAAGDGA